MVEITDRDGTRHEAKGTRAPGGRGKVSVSIPEQHVDLAGQQVLGDQVQVPVTVEVGKNDLAGPLANFHGPAGRGHEQRCLRLHVPGLLISEDLDELLQLCDRIVVMYRGALVADVPRAGFDAYRIGALMAGAR